MRWQVNDGRRVRFWEVRWIEEQPLHTLCNEGIQLTEPEALIFHELWIEERGWDWSKIGDKLPNSILLKLASSALQVNGNVADKMGRKVVDGDFSVRSAYDLFEGRCEENPWQGWTLRVQLRVKTFVWLLAHDRAPTNHCLWRRKLVDSPECSRYSGGNENALHLARDCDEARAVWQHFKQVHEIKNFFSSPLKVWLLDNLKYKRREGNGIGWPESAWYHYMVAMEMAKTRSCLGGVRTAAVGEARNHTQPGSLFEIIVVLGTNSTAFTLVQQNSKFKLKTTKRWSDLWFE